MSRLAAMAGVLLDIDGTLVSGDRAIAGAPELLQELRRRGTPFRLVTNTTRRPRRAIAAALAGQGLDVRPDEIVVPSTLARSRILESGRKRAALLVQEATQEDFEGVEIDTRQPQWVVVGDLGPCFTWERLNRAFGWLRAGAGLLALQKNRYWHAGDERGLVLDAGPFVVALEYASGVTAEVLGKPAGPFFRLALRELGVPVASTWMVGDDAEADGMGARAAGCRSVLVRTGKFSRDAMARAGLQPDLLLDSVADLTE